jgi:hypothetical protein
MDRAKGCLASKKSMQAKSERYAVDLTRKGFIVLL